MLPLDNQTAKKGLQPTLLRRERGAGVWVRVAVSPPGFLFSLRFPARPDWTGCFSSHFREIISQHPLNFMPQTHLLAGFLTPLAAPSSTHLDQCMA